MFTGLVQATGRVASREAVAAGVRLWIEAGPLAGEARIGDSVAIDGCCLTVVERDRERLAFDAVPETLDRTTLRDRGPGDGVNLELPLRPTDRLGGHFVQGHVDTIARLVERTETAGDVRFRFEMPEGIARQIVAKGSVAIDGVSLTVADVDRDGRWFSVALIPHTLAATTLGARREGDRVNVEGDILAKYVASLAGAR
jgi:riboflavin synthase